MRTDLNRFIGLTRPQRSPFGYGLPSAKGHTTGMPLNEKQVAQDTDAFMGPLAVRFAGLKKEKRHFDRAKDDVMKKVKVFNRFKDEPSFKYRGELFEMFEPLGYSIKSALITVYRDAMPVLRSGELKRDENLKNYERLAKSLKQIPDEEIRYAWMRAMMGNKNNLWLRAAAAAAVESLTDKQNITDAIEKLYDDSDVFNRRKALEHILHHTDKNRQAVILSHLSVDANDGLRQDSVKTVETLKQGPDIKPATQPVAKPAEKQVTEAAKPAADLPNETWSLDQLIGYFEKFGFRDSDKKPTAEFKDLFVKKLAQVVGDEPKVAMLQVYSGASQIIFSRDVDRALRKQLTRAIAKIGDEHYRAKWIESLLKVNDSEVARAATANILTVQDVVRRDRMIEQVCGSSFINVRQMGAKLVPYHSDPLKKQQLLDKLFLDQDSQVRLISETVAGKHKIRNFFFGWWTLSGFNRAADVTPTSATATQVSANQVGAGQRIQELAVKLEKQMKTRFEQQPEVRQAFLNLYGSEANLPTADGIRKQFGQMAHSYLKSKQGKMAWLMRRGLDQGQLMEITEALLSAANHVGNVITNKLSNEQVELIWKIHQQQRKIQNDLEQAKSILAEQVLIKAQAAEQLKQHEGELEKLQKQYDEAMAQDTKGLITQLKSTLDIQKEARDNAAERDKACNTAMTYAQAKVDRLSAEIARMAGPITNVLLFDKLADAKKRLAELEKSENTVTGNKELDELIETHDKESTMHLYEQQDELAAQKQKDDLTYLLNKEKQAKPPVLPVVEEKQTAPPPPPVVEKKAQA